MGKDATLIRTCSIWRALDVVGDTPTLLILEASWLGARKFDEFRARTGLLKALLSDRLKRLVDAKLLEKQLYCEAPPRYAYILSEKGRAVYWTSLMMLRWELAWGSNDGKIAVTLTHKACGERFVPEPACGHCNATIDATMVDWQEGPGLGWMKPAYARRRQSREASGGATSLLDEAAQLMGDRWASLIMRSIFTGIRRFDDIRADTAIATNILAERLAWLLQIGVIRQRPIPGSGQRHEYRLTRKGVEYYPVLLMLMRWGDTYYVAPEGPPVILTHRDCGHPLDPRVVCSACRKPVEPEDVEYQVEQRTSQSAAA